MDPSWKIAILLFFAQSITLLHGTVTTRRRRIEKWENRLGCFEKNQRAPTWRVFPMGCESIDDDDRVM